MEDGRIIDLYWERSESAIRQTEKKYGKYCYYIAFQILHNSEDSEESVNDTYLHAWNSIPPQRPAVLKAFLGKITRNLALNRYEKNNAGKRGAGQIPVALDELQECIPNQSSNFIERIALSEILNGFLSSCSKEQRKIFMRRYWYFSSVKEIARDYNMSESKVKMMLCRLRKKLKLILEKEGVSL